MSKRSFAAILVSVFILATLSFGQDSHRVHQPRLTPQNSGTTQGLIAVSPVNSRIVWASGRGGTFVLTTDGGRHWKAGVVPGAEALQFRDVQGVSDKVAYLQSIGDNPTDFRIYKTTDGGANWTMQFQNQNPGAFYDCFAFWSSNRAISHSDSVDGVFPDLRTTDGTNWLDISGNMPPALAGEFSFASSGTCVATQGKRNAWITTGGATVARILATRDGGDTWNAYDTPLVSSPSAGGFSVAFRDAWHGIVGGGDLDPGDPNNASTATSNDGGQTWTLTNPTPVTGAIFGLAYVSPADNHGHQGHGGRHHEGEHAVVITANDGGAAWTPDEGTTWFSLTGVTGYWAVGFANPEAGWLVGVDGTILNVSFEGR
ncbi:MAG: oxidoreductase [Acidobacteria bacterium]|nr:oxidoreductase [Acidobacteriota bacterium]